MSADRISGDFSPAYPSLLLMAPVLENTNVDGALMLWKELEEAGSKRNEAKS